MDQIQDELLLKLNFSCSVLVKENIRFYGAKSDISALVNVSETVPWYQNKKFQQQWNNYKHCLL